MCNAGKKSAPQAKSGSPAGAMVAKLGSKKGPKGPFSTKFGLLLQGEGVRKVPGVGHAQIRMGLFPSHALF